MKNYKITGANKFNGNAGTWEISGEENMKKFLKGLVNVKIEMSEIDISPTEPEPVPVMDIPDAEELLYEMDAHNVDTVCLCGSFGNKKSYTRAQIKKSLGIL